jgi:hypothetical protein
MSTFSKKKIQIISLDFRHQKNIVKLFTNFKKIQNHTKLLQLEGAAPARTRSQAKRNSAGLSRRKETEGAAPLLHSWSAGASPTSTPSFLCLHTPCTTRRWTRSLGEQAAYAAPSREAVGSGGGDREAEVIRLVLHQRLRAGRREGSNAIRWLKNG